MFELPPLPYDHAALEPVIGRATMHLHHEKHHQKYVDTTNELLAKQGASPASLEDLVRAAAGDPDASKLFNNAAQLWNHTFFWTCMTAKAQTPSGALAEAINRDFGGLAELKTRFVEAGAAHFGSGWVWLAAEGETLKVVDTHDGHDLLTHQGLTPLLVCDLWEHAYYLDHTNDREAFLEAWFNALPNWTFAASQYAAARGEGENWKHPAPIASSGTGAAEKRSNLGR
ncbi:superoxide dismutase [Phenylobacterium sp.]|uniref:superoxide dismutase n=1 Tax=Phenylobacterium sp. TaxID=1871053 RepID=UPI0027365928|nr:superoxide dismutase [Phenylobacterium sp.]MDP3852824.1 superoxide dismutase [Phenylobacterium sp.]